MSPLLLRNICLPKSNSNTPVYLDTLAESAVTAEKIDLTTLPAAQQPWITPTLSNSWVQFGGSFPPPQYMKDSLGFVHLRGLMKSGTIAVTAFTLPAGYRPGFEIYTATASSGVLGIVDINASGVVNPAVGSSGSFSFDSITFRAEN